MPRGTATDALNARTTKLDDLSTSLAWSATWRDTAARSSDTDQEVAAIMKLDEMNPARHHPPHRDGHSGSRRPSARGCRRRRRQPLTAAGDRRPLGRPGVGRTLGRGDRRPDHRRLGRAAGARS